MKRFHVISSLLASSLMFLAYSQTTRQGAGNDDGLTPPDLKKRAAEGKPLGPELNSRLLEPELDDVFFRVDGERLIALEQELPETVIRGGLDVLVLQGRASSVRFRAGDLTFVVRSEYDVSKVDATAFYKLHELTTPRWDPKKQKLTPKTDKRELLLGGTQVFPTRAFYAKTVGVKFSGYGGSSYKIETESLPRGEYAFRRTAAKAVFCFGID
jgi:hypothetical protein